MCVGGEVVFQELALNFNCSVNRNSTGYKRYIEHARAGQGGGGGAGGGGLEL